VKGKETWWQCACGARLEITASQVLSKKRVCPQCGAVVGSDQTEDEGLSLSDTQMVSMAEMARIAQEGLEVGTSGEWDTTVILDSEKEGGGEK
jgi:hypothetical protein